MLTLKLYSDRHLVAAVGGNEYGGDFIDDD